MRKIADSLRNIPSLLRDFTSLEVTFPDIPIPNNILDQIADLLAPHDWWYEMAQAVDHAYANVSSHPALLAQASVAAELPLCVIVRKVNEFLRILEPYGYKSLEMSEEISPVFASTKQDIVVFSTNLDARSPWISPKMPLKHLMKAAGKLGMTLSELVERLKPYTALGLILPE